MSMYINMFFSYSTERLAQTTLGMYTSKRVATCIKKNNNNQLAVTTGQREENKIEMKMCI